MSVSNTFCECFPVPPIMLVQRAMCWAVMWCDVWIYLSSARQLFLRMCRCLFFWWGESMNFEIALLWEKKLTETFWTRLPSAGARFSQGYYPHLVPDVNDCVAVRHFWLEFVSHFSYYFRHSAFFCPHAMKGSQCSPKFQQLHFTAKHWSFNHTFVLSWPFYNCI